ncbi:hypothetical protein [Micromonospora sp. Llam0]|uniref:hypothetical protein n=1 Tax=Micromonospora sp. Llam0 TaxID=2485143 RepID=UPI0011CEB68F|nr:hypothetical protein [Micromonospora sp. Llam0]
MDSSHKGRRFRSVTRRQSSNATGSPPLAPPGKDLGEDPSGAGLTVLGLQVLETPPQRESHLGRFIGFALSDDVVGVRTRLDPAILIHRRHAS